jgi:type II pantothenate kinase
MLNINIDTPNVNIPEDTIGVDMGQTLSKLAYLEENKLKLSYFPTQTDLASMEKTIEKKKGHFKKISFTGGRSFNLFQTYSKSVKTNLINEFEANVKGIEILHLLEKKKILPLSLIVTIGTGTSMVSSKNSYEHLGGTAMGGGFFMGLIKTLFNINNFQEAMGLAKNGNRYNVDLKVSDIYAPEDDRVDLLFREFTAASLGKINSNYNMNKLKKEDFINSLISIIGENIGMIANLMAEKNKISTIVYGGGFLKENKIIRKMLSLISRVNSKKVIFLKNSEFSAAIGALVL